MNNNIQQLSVQSRLKSEIDYIISQLEEAFLSQHKCDKETELFLNFHDILVDRVVKFIEVYTPPKNVDEHFDLIRGFITQFYKHAYYSGAVKYSYKKTNNHFDRFVNIVTEDEHAYFQSGISENKLFQEVGVEDEIIQLDSQRRVTNAYNQFSTYLRPMEKLFFNGMRRGSSTNEIISRIGNSGFSAPSHYIASRIRKTLEFRLACFFAQEREVLFEKSVILKSINKYPKLNMRAFGEVRLSEIPCQNQLENAIKGSFIRREKVEKLKLSYKIDLVIRFDPKADFCTGESNIFARSKVDFNGKPHNRWVVFINHGLHCYCHVTGKSWQLADY